jgi:hypothetical protein
MLLTFAVAFSTAAGVLLAYWLFVILNAILQELFGK